MLKQDLTSSYDFKLDKLYQEIDDCNLKFIDSVALKRFIMKCGLVPTSKQVLAIIRRIDLDADARLSQKEFFESLIPIEAFTRGTLD
jgi:Ca2+-binding EF-hand superfamily protein